MLSSNEMSEFSEVKLVQSHEEMEQEEEDGLVDADEDYEEYFYKDHGEGD